MQLRVLALISATPLAFIKLGGKEKHAVNPSLGALPQHPCCGRFQRTYTHSLLAA